MLALEVLLSGEMACGLLVERSGLQVALPSADLADLYPKEGAGFWRGLPPCRGLPFPREGERPLGPHHLRPFPVAV